MVCSIVVFKIVVISVCLIVGYWNVILGANSFLNLSTLLLISGRFFVLRVLLFRIGPEQLSVFLIREVGHLHLFRRLM